MLSSKLFDSWAWPGVMTAARGSPLPSVTRWILVPHPPRERPSAWCSGSSQPPLFLRQPQPVRRGRRCRQRTTDPSPAPLLRCRPCAEEFRKAASWHAFFHWLSHGQSVSTRAVAGRPRGSEGSRHGRRGTLPPFVGRSWGMRYVARSERRRASAGEALALGGGGLASKGPRAVVPARPPLASSSAQSWSFTSGRVISSQEDLVNEGEMSRAARLRREAREERCENNWP